MNFRTYTENTFKKSVLKIGDLVNTVKSYGYEKVAVTDKSNIFGFMEAYKKCKEADMKFILGIDIEVKLQGEIGNFIILAKNEKGFDFIKKVTSISYLKNRDLIVDYETLIGSDDIIVLTGDKNSFLGNLILNKEVEILQQEISQINQDIDTMKLSKTVKKEKYCNESELADILDKKLKGQSVRNYIQVILIQKKLHLKRTLNAKQESAPVRARELMVKLQKDFGSNVFFEIIKGHEVEKKEYDSINNFIYNSFKEGIISKIVGSIPYMYKDKESKNTYLLQKIMDNGMTIEQRDSVDVGHYHIRDKEEFSKEFSIYPEILAFNTEIENSCELHMTDKGYLTPIVKIEDEVVLKKYNEYCDRWVSDGFKRLPLNSFFLKYLGYSEMFRRYGIKFGEDELYYMISELVFEEKNTKELQAMEETDLIEYAKEYHADRKTNIIKVMNKEQQKVISLFDYEFLVIVAMGFVDYFIIVSDYVGWAKKNGIPVGTGRGSGPGSILAYLSDITDIDPIRHQLLFTRFLNINRISYPDIDVDFADRDRVIDYCKKKYGEDHVAQVCTFGTMASKSVFKDICKAYNIPYYKSNELTQMILEDKDGGLKGTYDAVVEFREEINGNKTIAEIYGYALQLLGNKKQLGTHACAVIISPDPIYNHTIVQHPYDNNKNVWRDDILTQNEGDDCEKMGLIKMDFLGLSNLEVIRDCMADIKTYKSIDVDLMKINYDDQDVLKNIFALGDTDGVFQFESPGMKKYLRELKPDSLDNIIAMCALYRPGPIQYIGGQEADEERGIEFKPSYIKRKNGTEKVKFLHPDLENSLKETYGLCVYQESLMQMVRDYAGFSMGEADVLRKAVGKKKIEMIIEQKKIYMEKAGILGKDPKLSDKIWVDIVEPFGGYGFNKSHATAYAYIAMQTAYFKYYYRAMFIAHLINSNLSKELEDRAKYIENAIETGIDITKPNVNTNTPHFSYIDDSTIEFGLVHIKGVGENVAQAIVEDRIAKGLFTSFQNMLDRIGKEFLTKKSITALAKAGALDIFGIERDLIVYNADNDFFKEYMEDKREFMIHQKEGRDDPKNDLIQDNLNNEESVIGTIMSEHVLSKYKSFIRKFTVGTENIALKEPGKIKVFGIITKLIIKKSSKGTIATIGVECPEFYISFTLFTKDYKQYEEKLAKFKMVSLSGDLVYNKYGQNVYVDDLVIMNTSEFLIKIESEMVDKETEYVYKNIIVLEKHGLKDNRIVDVNDRSPEFLEKMRVGMESRPFGYTNIVLQRNGVYVFSKYCITPQN